LTEGLDRWREGAEKDMNSLFSASEMRLKKLHADTDQTKGGVVPTR
jgi:hypothetical protein